MIYKGSSGLKAYVGSTGVDKMYLGNTLVYSGESPYDEYGYIKKGMVAHFDGIVKGDTANAWTDLINDIALTMSGTITATDDGWVFPGTTGAFFRKNGYTWQSGKQYTSEVCIIPTSTTAQQMVFATDQGSSSPNNYRPMLLLDNTNNIIRGVNTYSSNGSLWSFTFSTNTVYTISASQSLAIVNGNKLTLSGSTGGRWNMGSQAGYFKISGRRRGSTNTLPFKGTIYSIRVYDRDLTEAEVLNNQRVDNERFNLGLSL